MSFDPNSAAAADSGIFGLPFVEAESVLVYLPVPWEATTSYGGGASKGPSSILEASRQVDLYDLDVEKPYEKGLFLLKESDEVRAWNEKAKGLALEAREKGSIASLVEVNRLGDMLNEFVRESTERLLRAGKVVGIVGGDHSVPFGAFEALAKHERSFGILHIDAHSDTRKAYEGFTWSHASIMYNALEKIPAVEKLVQVGIRDFCEEELKYCRSQGDRVEVFFDGDMSRERFAGVSWKSQVEWMVEPLPENVWVSFDIDGLDPRFCPHTGTPVPGGLDYQQATFLIEALARSGRKIVGFDLNEVAPDPDGDDEWDANVGARMLYKLSAWTLASQGKAKIRRA